MAQYREEQYRERVNRWSTDVREQELDLQPRREQRADGRWTTVNDIGDVSLHNLIHELEMDAACDIEDALEATDWE